MATATTKKRTLSPEGRKRIAEAQKKRWGKKVTSLPPVTIHEVENPASGILSFGVAIEALKKGMRAERTGWNGNGQFVYYVPADAYPARIKIAKETFGDDALVPYRAYLALKTTQGDVATWAPSTSDVLAEDWIIF